MGWILSEVSKIAGFEAILVHLSVKVGGTWGQMWCLQVPVSVEAYLSQQNSPACNVTAPTTTVTEVSEEKCAFSDPCHVLSNLICTITSLSSSPLCVRVFMHVCVCSCMGVHQWMQVYMRPELLSILFIYF